MDEMEQPTIEKWFQEYHDAVFNFLIYRLRTRDVEDLVQEVFLRAIRGLSGFRGDASPKTWLLSIAKSVAGDHVRGTQRTGLFMQELAAVSNVSDNSVESVVSTRETYRELLYVIAKLRKNYRDVVVLRELLQLSAKETGEILGWTPARVNVTLHRAHQKLKGTLIFQNGALESHTAKSKIQEERGN